MKKLILILLSALLFTGCGSAPESLIPPLSMQADSYLMENWRMNSFGTFCGYVQSADMLEVYPYFDLDHHISMKAINLSGHPFLEYLDTCVPGGETYDFNGITIISDGSLTYGCRIFDNVAVVASTDTLPMGYIRIALEHVWLSDS